METSKSLQLLDTNNVNISPVVGVDSIFYEEKSADGKIVKRKKLSDKLVLFEKNGTISTEEKTYDDVIASGGNVIIDISTKAVENTADVSMYALSVAKLPLADLVKAATGEGTYVTYDDLSLVKLDVSASADILRALKLDLKETDSSVKELWDSSNSGGEAFDPTGINSSIARLDTSVNKLESGLKNSNASISSLTKSVNSVNLKMTQFEDTYGELPDSVGTLNNALFVLQSVVSSNSVSIEKHDTKINALWDSSNSGSSSFNPEGIYSSIYSLDSSVQKLWDSSNSGGESFDPTDINSRIGELNSSINDLWDTSADCIKTIMLDDNDSNIKYEEGATVYLYGSCGHEKQSVKSINMESVFGQGNIDTTPYDLMTDASIQITNTSSYPLKAKSIIASNIRKSGQYQTVKTNVSYSLDAPWYFYDGEKDPNGTTLNSSLYINKRGISINASYTKAPSMTQNTFTQGSIIYMYGYGSKYTDSSYNVGKTSFLVNGFIAQEGISKLDAPYEYVYVAIGILSDSTNLKMHFLGGDLRHNTYTWSSSQSKLVPWNFYTGTTEGEIDKNVEDITDQITDDASKFDFASSDINFHSHTIQFNVDSSAFTGAQICYLTFAADQFEYLNEYIDDGFIDVTIFGKNVSPAGTSSYYAITLNNSSISSSMHNSIVYDESRVFISDDICTTYLLYGGQSYMLKLKYMYWNDIAQLYITDFILSNK